jgi:hypothetical protein
MLKQKQFGSDPFGTQTEDVLRTKPLSVEVPDIHETMRLAGVLDLNLGSAERRKRLLCCCGSPGCSIGPMSQVEET